MNSPIEPPPAPQRPPARPYRMTARRAAVERTRELVLDAAFRQFLDRAYDDVTVDAIADAAGVSRQTVHRQFGSKDDLLVAVIEWRRPRERAASSAPEPGDVDAAVATMVERYELMGDAVVRFLALEGRVEAVDGLLETGRAAHREEIERLFGPVLPRRGSRARGRAVLALYAATDVMVWKLLRRDFGLTRPETEAVVHQLVRGVLRTVTPSEEGSP